MNNFNVKKLTLFLFVFLCAQKTGIVMAETQRAAQPIKKTGGKPKKENRTRGSKGAPKKTTGQKRGTQKKIQMTIQKKTQKKSPALLSPANANKPLEKNQEEMNSWLSPLPMTAAAAGVFTMGNALWELRNSNDPLKSIPKKHMDPHGSSKGGKPIAPPANAQSDQNADNKTKTPGGTGTSVEEKKGQDGGGGSKASQGSPQPAINQNADNKTKTSEGSGQNKVNQNMTLGGGIPRAKEQKDHQDDGNKARKPENSTDNLHPQSSQSAANQNGTTFQWMTSHFHNIFGPGSNGTELALGENGQGVINQSGNYATGMIRKMGEVWNQQSPLAKLGIAGAGIAGIAGIATLLVWKASSYYKIKKDIESFLEGNFLGTFTEAHMKAFTQEQKEKLKAPLLLKSLIETVLKSGIENSASTRDLFAEIGQGVANLLQGDIKKRYERLVANNLERFTRDMLGSTEPEDITGKERNFIEAFINKIPESLFKFLNPKILKILLSRDDINIPQGKLYKIDFSKLPSDDEHHVHIANKYIQKLHVGQIEYLLRDDRDDLLSSEQFKLLPDDKIRNSMSWIARKIIENMNDATMYRHIEDLDPRIKNELEAETLKQIEKLLENKDWEIDKHDLYVLVYFLEKEKYNKNAINNAINKIEQFLNSYDLKYIDRNVRERLIPLLPDNKHVIVFQDLDKLFADNFQGEKLITEEHIKAFTIEHEKLIENQPDLLDNLINAVLKSGIENNDSTKNLFAEIGQGAANSLQDAGARRSVIKRFLGCPNGFEVKEFTEDNIKGISCDDAKTMTQDQIDKIPQDLFNSLNPKVLKTLLSRSAIDIPEDKLHTIDFTNLPKSDLKIADKYIPLLHDSQIEYLLRDDKGLLSKDQFKLLSKDKIKALIPLIIKRMLEDGTMYHHIEDVGPEIQDDLEKENFNQNKALVEQNGWEIKNPYGLRHAVCVLEKEGDNKNAQDKIKQYLDRAVLEDIPQDLRERLIRLLPPNELVSRPQKSIDKSGGQLEVRGVQNPNAFDVKDLTESDIKGISCDDAKTMTKDQIDKIPRDLFKLLDPKVSKILLSREDVNIPEEKLHEIDFERIPDSKKLNIKISDQYIQALSPAQIEYLLQEEDLLIPWNQFQQIKDDKITVLIPKMVKSGCGYPNGQYIKSDLQEVWINEGVQLPDWKPKYPWEFSALINIFNENRKNDSVKNSVKNKIEKNLNYDIIDELRQNNAEDVVELSRIFSPAPKLFSVYVSRRTLIDKFVEERHRIADNLLPYLTPNDVLKLDSVGYNHLLEKLENGVDKFKISLLRPKTLDKFFSPPMKGIVKDYGKLVSALSDDQIYGLRVEVPGSWINEGNLGKEAVDVIRTRQQKICPPQQE